MAEDKIPDGMIFRGAQGANAHHINGHFKRVKGVVYNGRPLYQQLEHKNTWLRICPDGDWAVSYTDSKEQNNNMGWCFLTGCKGLHPGAGGEWRVLNGAKLEFQSSLVIKTCQGEEWKNIMEQVHLASIDGSKLREMLKSNPDLAFQLKECHWMRLKQVHLKSMLQAVSLPITGKKQDKVARLVSFYSKIRQYKSNKRSRDGSNDSIPAAKRLLDAVKVVDNSDRFSTSENRAQKKS